MKTKRGRPPKKEKTQLVAIRLPVELVEKLKAKGGVTKAIKDLLTLHLCLDNAKNML